MRVHRLLTLGSGKEPIYVWLSVQPFGDTWAATITADGDLPPGPGEVKGTMFFGATAEEVEAQAKAYLALREPEN